MELSNPWPNQYKITPTRGFGMVWHPVYKAMRFHHGVDVRGTFPLLVPHDGVVKHVSEDWDTLTPKEQARQGGGNVVLISHEGVQTIPGAPVGPTSIVTAFYHGRDKTSLVEGQKVVRGELITISGSTGFSTGDHCHFEVRRGPNGTWGDTLNPEHYLNGKEAIAVGETMNNTDPVLEINGELDYATWWHWQTALKSFGLYTGPIDGLPGRLTYTAIQLWAEVTVTGNQGPRMMRAVQRRLGVEVDAIWGPVTISELQKELLQGLAGIPTDEPDPVVPVVVPEPVPEPTPEPEPAPEPVEPAPVEPEPVMTCREVEAIRKKNQFDAMKVKPTPRKSKK